MTNHNIWYPQDAGFQKWGVPRNHPFLDLISPYKPSSYGGTPMYASIDNTSSISTTIVKLLICTNVHFDGLPKTNSHRYNFGTFHPAIVYL